MNEAKRAKWNQLFRSVDSVISFGNDYFKYENGVLTQLTEDEIKEHQRKVAERDKQIDEYLRRELPSEVTDYLNELISTFETIITESETRLTKLKELEDEYPHRIGGSRNFGEAIGYLQDTVSDLKRTVNRQ